jgi:very-short-patch-repair endonuclease
MNHFLKRYTEPALIERGWRPGTTLENRVAWVLSRFFTPDQISQQHRSGRFRIDFAHVAKRVAIEVDGWYHRSPEGSAKDAERDSWLRANGWIVLRIDDRHGEDALVDQTLRVIEMLNSLPDSTWKAVPAASPPRGSSPEPEYARIQADLQCRIAAGEWSSKSPWLPTQTELADHYGVSLQPIKAALGRLDALGVVILRRGGSAIVAERPD